MNCLFVKDLEEYLSSLDVSEGNYLIACCDQEDTNEYILVIEDLAHCDIGLVANKATIDVLLDVL